MVKKKVKKPKKKIKLSTVKKKAWDTFSLYIRHKHKDKNGMIECYTCGKTGRPVGDRFQAGHGIPGRTNALLFLEDVVRIQCMACNFFAGGRYRVFTPKLIEELGYDRYDEAAKIAKTTVKYKVKDYLEIADKYKNKLEELNKS